MAASRTPVLLWDIFCKVVDNFGDIGVSWRLATDLASRGQRVRFWVDDASALTWMAPQGCAGVTVLPWPSGVPDGTPGDVLLETFGCEAPCEVVAAFAEKTRATDQVLPWINLEYLSAEPYVERSHGLPSPVLSGPARGLTKHFFYPGFTPRTGGLLREPDLLVRQAAFDRQGWLAQQGIAWHAGERLISLFCYEPPALSALLTQLATQPQPTRLLVTPGRSTNAVRAVLDEKNSLKPLWNKSHALSISYLPAFTQHDFDHLLWACDLNFVRGEDSLVRALWAGKPLVWQIYPQHDAAHHDKLEAFLDVIDAAASLRQFHRTWNDMDKQPLGELELATWGQTVHEARSQLMRQTDLCSQLLEFVGSVRISELSHPKKR